MLSQLMVDRNCLNVSNKNRSIGDFFFTWINSSKRLIQPKKDRDVPVIRRKC